MVYFHEPCIWGLSEIVCHINNKIAMAKMLFINHKCIFSVHDVELCSTFFFILLYFFVHSQYKNIGHGLH